jgi:hypothetical protein
MGSSALAGLRSASLIYGHTPGEPFEANVEVAARCHQASSTPDGLIFTLVTPGFRMSRGARTPRAQN